MNTKLENAKELAREILRKDEEASQIQELLKHIQDRTTPDGYLELHLDDKTAFRVPATLIADIFTIKKQERDLELDTLATAILENGK